MHDEVESDFSKRCIQAARTDRGRIGQVPHRGDQPVASRESEVVVKVFVAVYVDLRGQLAVAGCADEEMDMCRAVTVAAELVQQLLGLAIRRARVAGGHA